MNATIKNMIVNNFVNPLDEGCMVNLKLLNVDKLNHKETISLLKQSYKTLNKSFELLEDYDFVASNALLRSALEFLAMAMLIEEREDVYEEFLDLYIEKRNLTAPQKLVGLFGGKLKKYASVLFNDTNRDERQILITDLYDTLCNYAHSSLLIVVFDNIENTEEKETLKMAHKLNLYFVKIILYMCMKYLTKNKKEHLSVANLVITVLLYFSEFNNYVINNKVDFNKYNGYFNFENENTKYNLKLKGEKMMQVLNEIMEMEFNEEQKKMFGEMLSEYCKTNSSENK